MIIRLIATLLFPVVLAACTSTGAPSPGESAALLACEVGERRVCTGVTGSRLKKSDGTSCACRLIDDVQQF